MYVPFLSPFADNQCIDDSVAIGFCGIFGNSLALTVASLPALNHYIRSNFSRLRGKNSTHASKSTSPLRDGVTPRTGPSCVYKPPQSQASPKRGTFDNLMSPMPTYHEIELQSGNKSHGGATGEKGLSSTTWSVEAQFDV